MRLEITRRTGLATRALLELALLGRRAKSSELSERVGTTAGFLSQVMTPLLGRGWVTSEPGPSGGYLATVDLDEVNVLDVIEAVEGPTETGQCVVEGRPCAAAGVCALHQPWARAREHLLTELARTPLSSLSARGRT